MKWGRGIDRDGSGDGTSPEEEEQDEQEQEQEEQQQVREVGNLFISSLIHHLLVSVQPQRVELVQLAPISAITCLPLIKIFVTISVMSGAQRKAANTILRAGVCSLCG